MANRVRLGVTIAFFLGLLTYHFIGVFLPSAGSRDVLSLWQLASLVTAWLIYVAFALTSWVPQAARRIGADRFLLGFPYIAGKYEGRSHREKRQNGSFVRIEGGEHIERFTITQDLFETKISGQSFAPDTNSLRSSWGGRLFKIDDDDTYYFGINLTFGDSEVGVLSFKVTDGDVHGQYNSGLPGTDYAYKFSAKRVPKFTSIVS